MTDARFLTILNDAAAAHPGIWDTSAARSGDASAIAAWAAFLAQCVAGGVAISDDRWRALEVRAPAAGPRFALPVASTDTKPEDDFSVGLTLLMNLLERDPD